MPAGDGTGPLGLGPMTGGGRGWCRYWLGLSPWAWGAYSALAVPPWWAWRRWSWPGLPWWGYGPWW